jgi:uncharacterized protein YdbL (DUF1318 family)
MGKILLTVLIGAAVAGVVYYLVDEEGAKKVMGNIKDAATDAYDQIGKKFGKVTDDVNSAMGQQA